MVAARWGGEQAGRQAGGVRGEAAGWGSYVGWRGCAVVCSAGAGARQVEREGHWGGWGRTALWGRWGVCVCVECHRCKATSFLLQFTSAAKAAAAAASHAAAATLLRHMPPLPVCSGG